jgi:release factor glutamine methyltransferase
MRGVGRETRDAYERAEPDSVDAASSTLDMQHGARSTRSYWDALAEATERLEDVTDSPQLDAELLLRHVTGLGRTQLFLRYEQPLTPDYLDAYEALVARREAGEPIPYILGRRWFRTIELAVDRRVLIPRPETERLVDYALDWLKRHPGPRRVVDVGTGSGAVALALATELGLTRPDVAITGTDIDALALEVARENRSRLGLDQRVELLQADLLEGVPGPFDVILANLPYLRPDQTHYSTALEPPVALFGGPDGFDIWRRLLRQSVTALAPGGLLAGEFDPEQAELAVAFARDTAGRPAWNEPDYSGEPRYLLVGDR